MEIEISQSKESCFTSDYVKPKVVAPVMYAINVKPIPHPLKNNRSAHLNYISHLKESVETVREIVEEARVVKPLDNALNYACQYTKLSQELLEYVIGTCPKSFNERDNKAPSTPVTRKKQVTFSDKPGTSSSNTQKHEVHQKVQQTNIPVIPSTGVNDSTEASGSKPRSNTKKNRILPAKKENKKEVEVHLRTNKSVWTKVNRVDSSISSKRVVINSNSESVCKTCNKCLNSASHEMCVVNILNSVNATSTVKIVLNKGKQIWKPKGRLSDNSLYKTKRVWKATGKLFTDIGYQWRPTGKKLALGKLDCGYQWRPTGKKFALGEMCHLTKLSVKCRTGHALVSGLRLFKTYDGGEYRSKAHEIFSNGPVRMSSGPEPFIMTPGTTQISGAPTINKELGDFVPPVNLWSTTMLKMHRRQVLHRHIDHITSSGINFKKLQKEPTHEDTPINHDVLHPSHNLVTGDPGSAQSSSGNVNSAKPNQVNQPPDHLRR
ncbi:hypothetical protein Tco_0711387 [Tanacetum coccineum]